MGKDQYAVIIADMIGSRTTSDRIGVQRHLEKLLRQINLTYKGSIASQFIITLGDEFQGVLHNGSIALKIIQKIQHEMYPTVFRFGIGIGSLSIELQADTSLGSDGTAFHLARDMIQEVKALESKKTESKASILIGIENRPNTSRLLNTICKLLWSLQSKWTERQREVITTQQQYDGTQAETARRLGIVQSSVQKSLASSQYYTYKEAIGTVEHILEHILDEEP